MPRMLVVMNSPALRIERSTWVSAAKLMTASKPLRERGADGLVVGDVALDEVVARAVVGVLLDVREVFGVAGVGELVEIGYLDAGAVGEGVADEVGADKPASAGDEESLVVGHVVLMSMCQSRPAPRALPLARAALVREGLGRAALEERPRDVHAGDVFFARAKRRSRAPLLSAVRGEHRRR